MTGDPHTRVRTEILLRTSGASSLRAQDRDPGVTEHLLCSDQTQEQCALLLPRGCSPGRDCHLPRTRDMDRQGRRPGSGHRGPLLSGRCDGGAPRTLSSTVTGVANHRWALLDSPGRWTTHCPARQGPGRSTALAARRAPSAVGSGGGGGRCGRQVCRPEALSQMARPPGLPRPRGCPVPGAAHAARAPRFPGRHSTDLSTGSSPPHGIQGQTERDPHSRGGAGEGGRGQGQQPTPTLSPPRQPASRPFLP